MAFSHSIPRLFSLILTCVIFSLSAQAANTVPETLKPWVPWVLKGHETLKCPHLNKTDYTKSGNHICAWPSALQLDAKNSGGTFSQSWQVIEKSWLTLPGDSKNWPQNVTVNGKPAQVISHKSRPALFLPTGDYQISGQFNWLSLPESLKIPSSYAFVTMTVNGESIAFPKIVGGELWLKELEVTETQLDATTVYVNRKLSDRAYLHLETRINLEVSGKRREQKLGKVLPPGFQLTGIEGQVSAFLDGEGILHAKLQPGNWEIIVNAYAPPTLLNWQRPKKVDLWPEQEIWAFEAQERFRVGKLTGGKVIDASLANLPQEWHNLPSYVMQVDDRLSYTVQHRGQSAQLENALVLKREMWLSFDHSQFAFNDTISGSMVNGWRLSMPAPYLLESGDDRDGAVLVTSQKDGERGMENRYPDVDFKARGVVALNNTLPVTGWDNHFESVSMELNLPPANRLFAVFGADSVTDSWWGNWTIWSSFIVLFSAFLAGRTIGVSAGILTAGALVLTFQENEAPITAMINMLLSIAIAKYQPFERLKPLVRAYLVLSIMALVVAVLYFAAGQIRTMMYPQLEARTMPHFNMPQTPTEASEIDGDRLSDSASGSRRKQQLAEPSTLKYRKMLQKPKAFVKERYQSDALMQAGAGIPSWNWHRHQINWSSPVAKNQQVQLLIMSQWVTTVFKAAGVILVLLWLYSALKKPLMSLLSSPKASISAKALLAVMGVCLFTPLSVENARADTLPSLELLDALEKRVTEAPKCAPLCATINTAHLTIDANKITLTMQVHALSDTAVSLPHSTFWRPEQLTLNGKRHTTLYKRKGWHYYPVNKGIVDVIVSGTIASVDVFQLRFHDQPKHLTHDTTSNWDIIGIKQNRLVGNSLEFMATAQKQKTLTPNQSTHYAVSPYVKVLRQLAIGQTWSVKTTVSRIAPVNGSISMKVPMLPGEHVISGGITAQNGDVDITINADKNTMSWHSTLDRQQLLTLTADTQKQRTEKWQVTSSPAWHVELSGLVMVASQQGQSNEVTHTFYPYDGESLTLDITRPEAVKGHALAIDKVNFELNQGTRTSKITLNFDYRSTRGGEHTIDLPDDFLLKEVQTNGRNLNLQPEGNKLTLPILPGTHTVSLKLRANDTQKTLLSTPMFNLNAPVSNITSKIDVSKQRWVLWAKGPVIGPAVVYWGELLVFILLALLLTRYPFSPLGTLSWLILGFGLSLNNWTALVMVALWFGSLTASKYRPKTTHPTIYNLSQIVLVSLSVVTLLTLISTIPMSLLGSPNMGITGNQSYGNHLKWFADQSDGLLSTITVLSIPIVVYKGIMLLWVLWLSFSLLGWIKWAWRIIGEQDYWRASANPKLKPKPIPQPQSDDVDFTDDDVEDDTKDDEPPKTPAEP